MARTLSGPFVREMQIDFPLLCPAQRADLPRLFCGMHIAAFAADPDERMFGGVQYSVPFLTDSCR